VTTSALICCAYPFGYGPAVKLLLISCRLRAAGLQTIFVGHGIAHEMAAGSDAFQEVIHALPGNPDAARRIASADGLFSMMERDFTGLALDSSRPVYVADSLHWMRDEVPVPFAHAQCYWVQNFVSADPHPRAGAIPVGPIVEPRRPTPEQHRHGLVINLGGCESPAGPAAEDYAYGDFVMRGLLRSGVPDLFQGDVCLLAGSRAVSRLRAAFPDCRIPIRSVSHDDALDLLGTAACVLTSPGLTASLECFQFAVPTYFLPPQNYSQWRILNHLQDAGLAAGAFSWPQVMDDLPAFASAPEAGRTPIVRRIISELSTSRPATRIFAESLQRWAATDQHELARRQREFFESLGPNGVDAIAGELLRAFGVDRDPVDVAGGVMAGKAWS